jgi:3-oxoacyl-[acyl-carrier-protein] synthase II
MSPGSRRVGTAHHPILTDGGRCPPYEDLITPRVVVTGIGLVTGLGSFTQGSWDSIKAGRSAVRRLTIPGFSEGPPLAGCPGPEWCYGKSDPALLNAKVAAEQACWDAAIDWSHIDLGRCACLVGMSKGGVRRLVQFSGAIRAGGEVEPDMEWLWPESWPSGAAGEIARRFRFRGPSLAPIAACATGLIAALQAADLIKRGACDLALAGAGDSSLEPLVLGAFRRMGVLARVEDDPARAVRPWDRGRSGFLVGEGAAVLVLEREDHAHARGVRPYAELAGGAFGSDAFHETNLNPDPSGLAHLIGRALANAGVSPEEIDHVNVHGTATRSNDPLECCALRLALGEHADRVACSANKSQIGHLLGAAGAAELAIACLAIRDGFVPPTLNLDDPDPACDLDGTPHVGRAMPIRAALKLSIGFGGHLAVAVLRRPEC